MLDVAKEKAEEFLKKIMDQGEDPIIANAMLTGTIRCPQCNGNLYVRKTKDGTAGRCDCGIAWNDYDNEAEKSDK